MSEIIRCFGNGKAFYEKYHDEEWGVPMHDDRHLFEMLSLEGAQAGLSWETILKRRQAYKKLFYNFEPSKIVQMTDLDLEKILKDPSIIRNKLKVYSVRQNANVLLQIQKEFGSFDAYVWGYVGFKPVVNQWNSLNQVPATSDLSDQISKDLKKRGMKFVGSTIIYSFMQAVGLVNDHIMSCHCRACQK